MKKIILALTTTLALCAAAQAKNDILVQCGRLNSQTYEQNPDANFRFRIEGIEGRGLVIHSWPPNWREPEGEWLTKVTATRQEINFLVPLPIPFMQPNVQLKVHAEVPYPAEIYYRRYYKLTMAFPRCRLFYDPMEVARRGMVYAEYFKHW